MRSGAIRQFWRGESGATAIEYGLLALLVAVAIIGTFAVLGDDVETLFNDTAGAVVASQAGAN